MNTVFTNAIAVYKLLIKRSEIIIDEILDNDSAEDQKNLAGRFLIITNTDLPESEVVSAYKEQRRIERVFRAMKSLIEIRPVYHMKSEKIMAMYLCVLALLISRII